MLRYRMQFIRKRKMVVAREPAKWASRQTTITVVIVCRIVKEQRVVRCANILRIDRCLGFALHASKGPSKSTERKVPYCLTRTSTGSVMR